MRIFLVRRWLRTLWCTFIQFSAGITSSATRGCPALFSCPMWSSSCHVTLFIVWSEARGPRRAPAVPPVRFTYARITKNLINYKHASGQKLRHEIDMEIRKDRSHSGSRCKHALCDQFAFCLIVDIPRILGNRTLWGGLIKKLAAASGVESYCVSVSTQMDGHFLDRVSTPWPAQFVCGYCLRCGGD